MKFSVPFIVVTMLFVLPFPVRAGDVALGSTSLDFSVNPCNMFNQTECPVYGCHWCLGDCERFDCPTAPSIPAGTGGYVVVPLGYPVIFDLTNLTIVDADPARVRASFEVWNKGYENPLDIEIHQRIVKFSTFEIIFDKTETQLLENGRAVFNDTLVSNDAELAPGYYEYEVSVFAKNHTVSATANKVFNFGPQQFSIFPTMDITQIGNQTITGAFVASANSMIDYLRTWPLWVWALIAIVVILFLALMFW